MKKVFAVILLLLSVFNISALYAPTEITEFSLYSDLEKGFFPDALGIKAEFEGIQPFKNHPTVLDLRFNIGYSSRGLSKDPETGEPFTDETLWTEDAEYDVFYSSWNIGFLQKFGSKNDFSAYLGAAGQFEAAYNPVLEEGNIFGRDIFDGRELPGIPELGGDRKLAEYSGKLRFSMPFFSSEFVLSKDYFRYIFSLGGSKSISDGLEFNASSSFRFLEGKSIPLYMTGFGGAAYSHPAENSTFSYRFSMSLDYEGKKFLKGIQPTASLEAGYCLDGGKLNNIVETRNIFVHSASVSASVKVLFYDVFYVSYELGYVFFYNGTAPGFETGFQYDKHPSVGLIFTM